MSGLSLRNLALATVEGIQKVFIKQQGFEIRMREVSDSHDVPDNLKESWAEVKTAMDDLVQTIAGQDEP